MNANIKIYLRFVALLVVVTTFLPIIYGNVPSMLGSRHFYALLWFVSVVFFYPAILLRRYILYLLLYGLIFLVLFFNTLWANMEESNMLNRINEYYVSMVAITILVYFIMVKDYEGFAWLVKWALIFIGITSILTIYCTSIEPLYIRMAASGDTLTLQKFRMLGGGGYGFASALVALFPIMVYYYRNNNISIFSKRVIIAYGTLCFFTLVRAQIFTNILLAVVVIFLSIMGGKRLWKSLLIILFLSVVYFIIPKTFYSDVLVSISSFFDKDSNIYYKLNDMATYIVYGDRYSTGVEGRTDRYPILIEAFSESPILGYFAGNQIKTLGAGIHLFWMNRLVISGILGFSAYLLIHLGYIKMSIKLFNKEYTFYFLLSVLVIFVLGLLKVLIGRELWFTYFTLLPGAFFLPFLKKAEK